MKESITEVVEYDIRVCDELVTFVGRKLETIKFALFLIKGEIGFLSIFIFKIHKTCLWTFIYAFYGRP